MNITQNKANAIKLAAVSCLVFLAMGSGVSDEDIADEYDISVREVKSCKSNFSADSKNLTSALEIVSKESYFFGIFGPDCDSLKEDSLEYPNATDFFFARQKDFSPEELSEFRANEIKQAEELEKKEKLERLNALASHLQGQISIGNPHLIKFQSDLSITNSKDLASYLLTLKPISQFELWDERKDLDNYMQAVCIEAITPTRRELNRRMDEGKRLNETAIQIFESTGDPRNPTALNYVEAAKDKWAEARAWFNNSRSAQEAQACFDVALAQKGFVQFNEEKGTYSWDPAPE